MKYNSLDRMIEYGCDQMWGDPWKTGELLETTGVLGSEEAWQELRHIHGQISYEGDIFLVTHQPAQRGMGGMDEGSPESILVYRIHLNDPEPDRKKLARHVAALYDREERNP